MSEMPNGPGWWRASDGRWYPPVGLPPPTPWPPSPTPVLRVSDGWFWTAVGAAVAVVIGAALPWVTATAPFVGTISRSGIDGGGDGLITGAIGVGIGVIALATRRRRDRNVGIAVVLLAVVLIGLAIAEMANVQHRINSIDSRYVSAEIGIGLYVTLFGAVAGIVAGVLRFTRR